MDLYQQRKNPQIQGLRALAIAVIVLSHCGIMRHYGQIGDVFFFCLSGFFAMKPFVAENFEIHSLNECIAYYKKKAVNILPAYWGWLIILKLLTGDLFFTWRAWGLAFCFWECPSHLWFLQQIVLMYAVTPFIIVFISIISEWFMKFMKLCDVPRWEENKELLLGGVLLLLSIIVSKYLTKDVFYLLGNGAHQRFMIWQYMIGMSVACLYRGLKIHRVGIGTKIAGFAEACIMLLSVLSSDNVVSLVKPGIKDFYLVFWSGKLDWVILFFSGLLILLFSFDRESMMSKVIGNSIFEGLGNISFETYIIHVYLLSLVGLGSTPLNGFIIVYCVTVCVAYLFCKVINKYKEMFGFKLIRKV